MRRDGGGSLREELPLGEMREEWGLLGRRGSKGQRSVQEREVTILQQKQGKNETTCQALPSPRETILLPKLYLDKLKEVLSNQISCPLDIQEKKKADKFQIKILKKENRKCESKISFQKHLPPLPPTTHTELGKTATQHLNLNLHPQTRI